MLPKAAFGDAICSLWLSTLLSQVTALGPCGVAAPEAFSSVGPSGTPFGRSVMGDLGAGCGSLWLLYSSQEVR